MIPILVILLTCTVSFIDAKTKKRHKLSYLKFGGSANVHKRPFFYPKPSYRTYGKRKSFHSSSKWDASSVYELGWNTTLENLGLGPEELTITAKFTDTSNVTHMYFKHLVNGIQVNNHHAAIHLNKMQVIAFSSSFGTPEHLTKRDSEASILPPFANISDQDAIQIALKEYNIPLHKVPVILRYVEIPDGTLVYCYGVQLKNLQNWLMVYVDASDEQIIHVVDYLSSSKYKVVPFTESNPLTSLEIVENPDQKELSPHGWHRNTKTDGNNARVYSLLEPGNRRYYVDGSKSKEFVFDANFEQDPTEESNRNLAITNLFYIVNMMHDLSYAYGFNEESGNFQFTNFGNKGLGGDGVIVRAQMTTSTNDATFSAVFISNKSLKSINRALMARWVR